MAHRTKEELATAFANVADRLNNAIDAARDELNVHAIGILDLGAGGDLQYGIPYFIWRHHFQRRHTNAAFDTVAVGLELKYLEPVFDDEPRGLEWTLKRDTFRPGAGSDASEKQTGTVALEDVCANPATWIIEMIERAEQDQNSRG